ncbi:MAG TPA: FTR1 family protein [Actinomycetes bacterium]|nr:FTR1 family protein [Actinomycetes bacterium]
MLTALLIMLREGFEAALVVGIVYAYIRRIDRPDLVTPMWQGMAAAAAVSIAAGIVVHLTVENLSGQPRLLAFAAVSLLAVVVLTWMIFWMRRQAHLIKGELQDSVDQAIASRGDVRVAVMTVAFLAVAREGLEAALFLIAAATTEDGWAVLIGGLIGLAGAAALGALVVLGGRRIPMRQFFTVTGLILIVFAAGLVSRTVLWLQAAGELGTVWNNVYDLTAFRWLTVSTESGKFLGAMFGWDPRPSIEQIVAYLLFLVTVSWLFLRAPRTAEAPRAAVRR